MALASIIIYAATLSTELRAAKEEICELEGDMEIAREEYNKIAEKYGEIQSPGGGIAE